MTSIRFRQTWTRATTLAIVAGLQIACAGLRALDPIDSNVYASGSAFVYQPINPITIWLGEAELTAEEKKNGVMAADVTSVEFNKALLRDLDTETVRISLARASGSVSAVAAIGGSSIKGESYVLIADYIKYFASARTFDFDYMVKVADPKVKGALIDERRTFKQSIPVYSGIGVRVRAEFTALESGLDISGLPALAVAAKANRIAGRLTMQTLGISGPEVSPLMVFLSDISVGSIQSAVQAVSAVKAKMYEPSTTVYPKLVGFEAPANQLDAIPWLTSELYALERTVCAKQGPRPGSTAGRTDKPDTMVWIAWEDPNCDKTEAKPPRQVAARP